MLHSLVVQLIGSKNRDGRSGGSGGGRHDEDGDVFLEIELAGVEEFPDPTARRVRHDGRPSASEEEGDDLEEQLRDIDRLGPEVEDLTEDGGERGDADACVMLLAASDFRYRF